MRQCRSGGREQRGARAAPHPGSAPSVPHPALRILRWSKGLRVASTHVWTAAPRSPSSSRPPARPALEAPPALGVSWGAPPPGGGAAPAGQLHTAGGRRLFALTWSLPPLRTDPGPGPVPASAPARSCRDAGLGGAAGACTRLAQRFSAGRPQLEVPDPNPLTRTPCLTLRHQCAPPCRHGAAQRHRSDASVGGQRPQTRRPPGPSGLPREVLLTTVRVLEQPQPTSPAPREGPGS